MDSFEIESAIPALILSAVYCVYQRKNSHTFGPISLLIFIYLFVAVLSVIARGLGWIDKVFDINVIPMLYLAICIGISLWGFLPYKDVDFSVIRIDNFRLYRKMETVLLVSAYLSILFFTPSAISAFQGDINELRTTELFKEHIEQLSQWGYVNTFCSLSGNLFVFNLVFAYLNLANSSSKKSQAKAGLLFASSLVYVVYIFAYVGRDGVALWIMSTLSVTLFFKQFVDAKTMKYLMSVFSLLALVLFIPFAIITVARFSVHDAGVSGGFWYYLGDQVTAFNDQFIASVFSPPLWGQQNFPVFYRIFNPDFSSFDREEWVATYMAITGVMPWHFATYVGALLADFGYFITPLVIWLIAIITRLSLREIAKNKVMMLSQFMVLILCYQIVLFGVFYFKHSSSNLYVIVVLLFALMLKFSRGSSSSIDIKRHGLEK